MICVNMVTGQAIDARGAGRVVLRFCVRYGPLPRSEFISSPGVRTCRPDRSATSGGLIGCFRSHVTEQSTLAATAAATIGASFRAVYAAACSSSCAGTPERSVAGAVRR
jgi:hypothetical protein